MATFDARIYYCGCSSILFGDRIHVVVGRFGCPSSSAISIEASLRSPHNALHSPSYIGGALHPSPKLLGVPEHLRPPPSYAYAKGRNILSSWNKTDVSCFVAWVVVTN